MPALVPLGWEALLSSVLSSIARFDVLIAHNNRGNSSRLGEVSIPANTY